MDTQTLPDAKPASLLRAAYDGSGFPRLDSVGERLSRGLTDLIGDGVRIEQQPVIVTSFGEWRARQNVHGAICRIHLHPIKGAMLVSVPPALISRMVDIFYGGSGECSEKGTMRVEFTAAELRFLSRFADQCLPLLNAAWAGVTAIDARLLGIETEMPQLALVKDDDLIVIAPFLLRAAGMGEAILSCIYSAASLRSVAALCQSSHIATDSVIDPVWRERLAESVMQVRLPMRSIFARPELPLSQLLTLKSGDFIPICLPSHLPITIAERLFAHGSVGDASGRTAIRIEKIEQGNANHE